MTYSTVLKADTLAAHLEDPEWVILDCRFNLDDTSAGQASYLQAHIPGAVYVHLDEDLSDTPSPQQGRHPLPDVEHLARTFGGLGIHSGTQVVAYDLPFAARAWWLLRYLGHNAVCVLDGGIQSWLKADLPTRQGEETNQPVRFKPSPQNHLITSMDDILQSLSSPDTLHLIDSRSPERYRGEHEPRDPVAARIPGAANHFWGNNLMPDGFLKRPEQIKIALETALGNHSVDQSTVYCGSGVTAAVNALAFEYAGLGPVRLYPGSWSQWCSNPERPIERG